MGVAIAAGIGAAATVGGAAYSASQAGRGGSAPGIETTGEKLYRTRRRLQQGWQTMDAQDALWYAALQDRMAGNQLFGNQAQNYSMPFQNARGGTSYRNFNIPGSEGQLAMMARAQPQLQALQRSDMMALAGNTADTFSQYSPQINDQAYQNARNFDPMRAQLSDALMQQAQAGVNSGGQNTYEDRYLQQQIRGAQAARGRGFGNADLYQEAVGLDRNRQDRQIKQGDFAQRVLGLRSATFQQPDAANILFGRASGGSGYAGAVGGAYGANQMGGSSLLNSLGTGGALEQNAFAMDRSIANQNSNSMVAGLGGLGNAATSLYNTPNPYYGMSPGNVPYGYGGMPDSPFRFR